MQTLEKKEVSGMEVEEGGDVKDEDDEEEKDEEQEGLEEEILDEDDLEEVSNRKCVFCSLPESYIFIGQEDSHMTRTC